MIGKLKIFLFLLCFCVCCFQTSNTKARITEAKKEGWVKPVEPVSDQEKRDFKILVSKITGKKKKEYEKAYAIASYLASHFLSDDIYGWVSVIPDFQKKDITKHTLEPEQIMRYKTINRWDFARLFDAMCKKAGIRTGAVFGSLSFPSREYIDGYRRIGKKDLELDVVNQDGSLGIERIHYCEGISFQEKKKKVKKVSENSCLKDDNHFSLSLPNRDHVWNYFVADGEKIYVDVYLMATRCKPFDEKSLIYCERLLKKYCKKDSLKTQKRKEGDCYFPFSSDYFDFLYEDEILPNGLRDENDLPNGYCHFPIGETIKRKRQQPKVQAINGVVEKAKFSVDFKENFWIRIK